MCVPLLLYEQGVQLGVRICLEAPSSTEQSLSAKATSPLTPALVVMAICNVEVRKLWQTALFLQYVLLLPLYQQNFILSGSACLAGRARMCFSQTGACFFI